MIRRIFAVAFLLGTACSQDLGVMSKQFRCAKDEDCIDGWACDPSTKLCAPAADDATPVSPDGGGRD
jgi:hypothetical protein